ERPGGGLCAGGALRGRRRPAHPRPSCAAEHRRSADRADFDQPGVRDPVRGRAQLPGPRRPGSQPVLGADAFGGPGVHRAGLVDGGLPGSGHLRRGARVQHARRRAARRPGPEAALGHRRQGGRQVSVLAVRDLNVAFRTRRGLARVVSGLSYDVSPGQTVAIVGESGSGKSVSALALLGLLPRGVTRVAGSAVFGETELIGLPEERLRSVRGAGIGMVFQDPMTSLNPVLTVERQIAEALRAHGTVAERDVRSRATELLDVVGIPDPAARLKAYPRQLSGGMRPRVMIAIALAG